MEEKREEIMEMLQQASLRDLIIICEYIKAMLKKG